MEATLTVTAKGQVTLRRALLDHLGVRPGDQVAVHLLPSGRLEIQAAASQPIGIFFGCLPAPEKSVSIEEMNRAIEDGWATSGQ